MRVKDYVAKFGPLFALPDGKALCQNVEGTVMPIYALLKSVNVPSMPEVIPTDVEMSDEAVKAALGYLRMYNSPSV